MITLKTALNISTAGMLKNVTTKRRSWQAWECTIQKHGEIKDVPAVIRRLEVRVEMLIYTRVRGNRKTQIVRVLE